jgi:hypothetical protein
MRRQRTIVVLVLLLWALLGPIGMPFTSCPLMSLACDDLCGATALRVVVPAASVTLLPMSMAGGLPAGHLPTPVVFAVDPPPRPLPLSA